VNKKGVSESRSRNGAVFLFLQQRSEGAKGDKYLCHECTNGGVKKWEYYFWDEVKDLCLYLYSKCASLNT
jgi:hypothetical protein